MVLCVFFLYFCTSLNLEGDLEAMEKNKILYVTQEINPFLIQSEISNLVRTLAQGVYETDKEIFNIYDSDVHSSWMCRFRSATNRYDL